LPETLARDFLGIHLPPLLRTICDLDTPRIEPGSFIEPAMRARPGPTAHSCANRAPVPKPFWQPVPFAAVLGDIPNRIQDLKVRQADVSTLARQTVLDLAMLRFGVSFPKHAGF
jgi:hypothetical protein